jgi:uncharacterized protein YndB with AHSA1/START domain
MIELRFERDIQADAGCVFSMLVELRRYDEWLPRSSAFHGTSEISPGPISVGTTYVEEGPFGVRRGTVTRLVRPTELDFDQPMTLRPHVLGAIGIRLFHRLTAATGAVHVLRRLELAPGGPAKLLTPLLVKAFRSENERIMKILKAAAETDTEK